ncbi:SDR family oxidoreductase [Paenibacillus sp. N3.4]|uniref:SDR family oxidoreductase n=1 Tax=Paenibacillus sp. N3.4 TaxID=2603222 RepID=UPI0011CAD088|nr:SDR family oxidoreductase [Paenibacillus sp. N3.4]TXK71263.1 SDR family oxidoreductase [Paenibacillus sp. N3.4]
MDDTAFSVKHLLQMPLFRDAKWIGGQAGITNEIFYIDSMEMPDLTASTDIAESCFQGKFWPQYFAAKYAVPFLSQHGSIVLMSGAASQRPIPGAASYAACNGAIESLGKALAIELAPIRVNVVAPGTIRTEKERTEAYEAYKGMCLLERVGDVQEIAHSVIYLMTNRYTTGSTLFPDGGYVLR